METLPDIKFKPLRGSCIVGFTAEQIKTFDVRPSGIVLNTSFHPDEHSIEEGIIVAVNDKQKELKRGDGVLVDYAIFSQGRHNDDRYKNEPSRCVHFDENWYFYMAYDDTHFLNSSEILALIDEKGKTRAFGDAVLVYPQKDTEALIKIVNSIGDLHDFQGTQWALVQSSPVKDIVEGDMILCEKGFFITIYYRGTEIQYVNLPYIFGIADITHPLGIRLF